MLKSAPAITAPRAAEPKTKETNQASVMLYIGAGLVVISTLVFVAFNWQTFPPFIQSFVIILTNLAFYMVGFLTLVVALN